MIKRMEYHINAAGLAALCRILGLFDTVSIPPWVRHLTYAWVIHTLAAALSGMPNFAEALKALL